MPCQGICWETNCRNNHNFGRNFHNNYGALRVANSWSNQAAARRRQETLARARKPSERPLCRLSAQNLLNLQIFVPYKN